MSLSNRANISVLRWREPNTGTGDQNGLTDWPAREVELLRRLLKDEPLVAPGEAFADGTD